MFPMKFGWMGLEILCLFLFLYYGSVAALCLSAVMIATVLVGLGKNWCIRKKLSLCIDATPTLRKGDSGTVTLAVTNPTAFPVLGLLCSIGVENQLNGQKASYKLIFWAKPRKTTYRTLRIGSEYCGRIRVTVEKGKLYDCFGLIGLTAPWDAVTHMVVQPDTFPMSVTLLPWASEMEDSLLYSQERPGQDLTETYQLREYVPGDSPRQIHWKLSGKLDRLIVRDPALPIEHNVLVFWERTGETGDPKSIDAQAEVVISLCRSLAEEKIPFTIGWNDTDRNLCILYEIRDMDTLIGVMPRLLRATGVREGVSGAALLMQTGSQALCAHMAYIAREPGEELMELKRYGHVTALLCGDIQVEDSLEFRPGTFRTQLAQIEL